MSEPILDAQNVGYLVGRKLASDGGDKQSNVTNNQVSYVNKQSNVNNNQVSHVNKQNNNQFSFRHTTPTDQDENGS